MVRAVKVVPLAEDMYAGPRSFDGGSTGGSGRRTMGKVPSLLFDVDDLNEASQHMAAEAVDEASVAEVKQKLQFLLEPWSEPEYMLLLHVRFAREDAAKRGQPLSVPDLADTLKRLGYAVKMRTALGGGTGGACLRTLRHSFLTVAVSGPSGSMTYVLDPRFRDQFEIAHTTPRYAQVLEAVGPEVVTPQDRLTKVVEILCCEMAHAFQETGTALPPWRQQAAMLSKWLPRRSEEVDLTAALNSGTGMAAGQPVGVQGGIGGTGAKRLTGPSTVAQRLALLGVVQQQSNPSPIAEGVELGSGTGSLEGQQEQGTDAEEGDEWEAVQPAPSSSPSSALSASSLHLDWDEAAESRLEDKEQAQHLPTTTAAPNPVSPHKLAPDPRPPLHSLLRRSHAAPAKPDGCDGVPTRGGAILEGIRAAAAALPHRRINTWTG